MIVEATDCPTRCCRAPGPRRARRLPRPLAAVLLVGTIVSHAATAVTTGPVPGNTPAYPPSCLAAPLVDVPSGPSYRQPTRLAAMDRDTFEFAGFETVDFTFWRVACEGGRSALLVRIARAQNANPAHVVQFPFAYGLAARQAGRSGALRLAQEPNTRTASLSPGALIDSALTLVVENLPQDADFPGFTVPSALPAGVHGTAFDFNQALDVVIPDARTAGIDPPPPPIVLSIPAYDERAYPEASAPMPISGYNSGNYDDPAHAGEGMIVEIGNRPAGSGEPSRYVSLAWFTYDAEHRPFWLFGVAPFVPGVRAIAVAMASFGDGGFAGDFGASSTPARWGSVSLSFPDCESMHFEYAARAGLQPPAPGGAGERNWTRVTEANGLACR